MIADSIMGVPSAWKLLSLADLIVDFLWCISTLGSAFFFAYAGFVFFDCSFSLHSVDNEKKIYALMLRRIGPSIPQKHVKMNR
jgi:hypothetical protein